MNALSSSDSESKTSIWKANCLSGFDSKWKLPSKLSPAAFKTPNKSSSAIWEMMNLFCFIMFLNWRRRIIKLLMLTLTSVRVLRIYSVITNVILGLNLLIVGRTDGSTLISAKITVERIGVRILVLLRSLRIFRCWLVINILLVLLTFQKVRNLIPLVQLLQLIMI